MASRPDHRIQSGPQYGGPASDTVSSEQEAEQHRENFIQQHYYDDDGTANFDDGSNFEFDAESFAEKWRDRLIVIPRFAEPLVSAGFAEAARAVGATVLKGFDSRSELLTQVDVASDISPGLVEDFFALGYVRLQVEMMTQKLRYSSDLDCERFSETAVAAAVAAESSNIDESKQHLQAAFDQLAEEKNRYYPVAADFVDMVLMADTIRIESIKAELESDSPKALCVRAQRFAILLIGLQKQ